MKEEKEENESIDWDELEKLEEKISVWTKNGDDKEDE